MNPETMSRNSTKSKVGFIGLGAMGLPMAKRIVGAGYKLCTTFHRRREPADELHAMGAEVVSTPQDVAKEADVVITILPADAGLREVVFGPAGVLKTFTAGKLLIEMTTGTALAMQEIAHAIGSVGGDTLDAPVSGGTPAAAQGTLTIMAGGDAAVLESCRPLLETMGTRIVHVGPVGQGKIVKIVNQMMAAIHLVAIGESFALGIKCGADPKILYEVIKDSSGYSKMMDLRLPGFLFEGSFLPGFKLDLMKKDVNLAIDSARAVGIPLHLSSEVAQVLAAASAAGKGNEDFSAAAQFSAGLSGVQLSATKDKSA